MKLPHIITKDSIKEMKSHVQNLYPSTSFYLKLRNRLLGLAFCLIMAFVLPYGILLLILFFLTDYVLYRAHRNHMTKEHIYYLENFLETKNLEEHYIEGIDHTLERKNLTGERLTYNIIRKMKLDEFIKRHNLKEAKLLDVGCSGGWLTESYKALPNYSLLFGVDLNLPGLRAYQKTHPDISPPVLGNVEDLPFQNESVDIVFATDIIEHLFHPDFFLREIRRILKPVGMFYLSTNNAHYIPCAYLINPLIVLEKIIGLYFPPVLPVRNLVYGDAHSSGSYYHSDFERKELEKLIADSGFKIIREETFNFLWDGFAPLGEKIKNRIPLRLYCFIQEVLETVPPLKYTGEHWYVELKVEI